jgi:hypothetical protein
VEIQSSIPGLKVEARIPAGGEPSWHRGFNISRKFFRCRAKAINELKEFCPDSRRKMPRN